ncbi:hypothetical protein [Novosphingobium pentaromativorans]|uniref:Uncharacterized protein n=1 Tax=Novosphingobium pentaromativorans US6-1 TaxID=1088721 RepID=G6E7G6_9SPHN|nr:hypothetical protein [Novosphingobium pentaromativorans]AIT81629.1 hypothetical protein JI59_18610 [Novosphingobium pentaromativorans US6-1]EHJ62789.1 hypothetical protein NSU_0301 [Novosphingobium pentaromativorans US6-1]
MNRTLSGKPAMREARRQHVHGPLQALNDDNLWRSIYSGLVWSNAAMWGVAAVIAAFVISH